MLKLPNRQKRTIMGQAKEISAFNEYIIDVHKCGQLQK